MSLKIGVLVKHVADTNARIKLAGDAVDKSEIKFIINPYDEYAIEEAIKTKAAWKAAGAESEIVAICLGPKAATKALSARLTTKLSTRNMGNIFAAVRSWVFMILRIRPLSATKWK